MLRAAVAYRAATSAGQTRGRFPAGRVNVSGLSLPEIAHRR